MLLCVWRSAGSCGEVLQLVKTLALALVLCGVVWCGVVLCGEWMVCGNHRVMLVFINGSLRLPLENDKCC